MLLPPPLRCQQPNVAGPRSIETGPTSCPMTAMPSPRCRHDHAGSRECRSIPPPTTPFTLWNAAIGLGCPDRLETTVGTAPVPPRFRLKYAITRRHARTVPGRLENQARALPARPRFAHRFHGVPGAGLDARVLRALLHLH